MKDSALSYHDFPADAETISSLSDNEAVDVQKVSLEYARSAMKPQPSQKPGESMMIAAAMGNREAIAIRDAWKFSIPVRKVTRAQYEAMTTRNEVTFHG